MDCISVVHCIHSFPITVAPTLLLYKVGVLWEAISVLQSVHSTILLGYYVKNHHTLDKDPMTSNCCILNLWCFSRFVAQHISGVSGGDVHAWLGYGLTVDVPSLKPSTFPPDEIPCYVGSVF